MSGLLTVLTIQRTGQNDLHLFVILKNFLFHILFLKELSAVFTLCVPSKFVFNSEIILKFSSSKSDLFLMHGPLSFDTCLDSCSHCQDTELLHHPENPPHAAPPSAPPSPQPLATTDLFSPTVLLSFRECHKNGTAQYVTF